MSQRDEFGYLSNIAQKFELKAIDAYYANEDTKAWGYLLLKEVYRYGRDYTSPRQKETHRLWQQRGLLERTKSNLGAILRAAISPDLTEEEDSNLKDAEMILKMLILKNAGAFKTISRRIPKEVSK